ncbi:MAG: hypothetical protein C4523_04135 [Myxococcales bacterium]|nr:MAG: hypothetical protein C4523_04135 [Myxococcales bacterium]
MMRQVKFGRFVMHDNRSAKHRFVSTRLLLVLLLLGAFCSLIIGCAGGDDDSKPGDEDNGDGPADADQEDDSADGDREDGDSSDQPVDGDEEDDQPEEDSDLIVPTTLFLNEIDCQGQSEWIEIVNTDPSSPVDAGGFAVADDLSDATHSYRLAPGTMVSTNGFLVVKQAQDLGPGFGFGIKCGQDTIYLVSPANTLADQVKVPDLPDDTTWGRLPDGTGQWRETSPTQGASNQHSSSEAGFLFSDSEVATMEITLSEASRDALASSPYEYAEGAISLTNSHGAYSVARAGIRLKGGLSFRPIGDKASFKIRFTEYDKTARLAGLKNITLNAMVDDPTMMRESLAYRIFRASDIPAPRTGYAVVSVNGEDYGLYALIEKYDDLFLAAEFPDGTRHLYEGMVDLYIGQEDEFDLDEGDEDGRGDLSSLTQAISETADGQWVAGVGAVLDLSRFTRFWAIENYIGHRDGYTLAANNYFLHSDTGGFFAMLPWGTDRAFTEDIDFPAGTGVVAAKCAGIPACRVQYDGSLADLLPVVDALNLGEVATANAALIAPYVADDPKRPYSEEEHQEAVNALETYLAERRAKAETSLQP